MSGATAAAARRFLVARNSAFSKSSLDSARPGFLSSNSCLANSDLHNASPAFLQIQLHNGFDSSFSSHVRFYSSSSPAPVNDLGPTDHQSSAPACEGKIHGNMQVTGEEESTEATLSTYWGITTKPIYRKDGTPWPWRSFMPWETYTADTSIDLKRHHPRESFSDKFAFWSVKTIRWPTDLFFQKRYGCRAMMLETVAAVPGMVGGMLLHLKSLRKFQHSGGWIRALLEEAENERMHLMTFMEVAQPKWYERALVFTVQGIFFNAYFLLYLASPRLAHRVVGYLEEEAVHSYTEYLREIDNGNLPNVPAPAIAIDYWRLPKGSRIRDVVEVVRADEAHHRDVNHFAADIHEAGKSLNDLPAPVGYH